MKKNLLYLIFASLSFGQLFACNVNQDDDGFDDLRKAVQGTSFQEKFVKIITLYEEANSSTNDKEKEFENLANELDYFVWDLSSEPGSAEITYRAGLFTLKNKHLRTFEKYAKMPYGAHWLRSIDSEKICEINNPGSAAFEIGKLYVQQWTSEIGKYEDRNDFTLYSNLTAWQWFDKFVLSVKDSSRQNDPFFFNGCHLRQSVGHYFYPAANTYNHPESQLILGLMHWHNVDLPETFDLSIIIPHPRPHREVAFDYLILSRKNGNEEATEIMNTIFPRRHSF